jgi:hypothetical protein
MLKPEILTKEQLKKLNIKTQTQAINCLPFDFYEKLSLPPDDINALIVFYLLITNIFRCECAWNGFLVKKLAEINGIKWYHSVLYLNYLRP